jgi:hypothetical protein
VSATVGPTDEFEPDVVAQVDPVEHPQMRVARDLVDVRDYGLAGCLCQVHDAPRVEWTFFRAADLEDIVGWSVPLVPRGAHYRPLPSRWVLSSEEISWAMASKNALMLGQLAPLAREAAKS